MRTTIKSISLKTFAQAVVLALAAASAAHAQDTPPAAQPEQPPAVESPEQAPEPQVERESPAPGEPPEAPQAPEEPEAPEEPDHDHEYHEHGIHGSAIVRFGSDAYLPADETADTVVSIFGSSTSAGEARDGVVSIFGDTRVTGRVGDAVVAVFGDTYVNSRVGGDVAAVFGNLELGPEADVRGEAVAVGGSIKRHPDAEVRGGIQQVSFAGEFAQFRWLRPWVEHCLLLGRPLALEPGLEWAWWLTFGFLAFYVLIALLFGGAVQKCAETLETHPGETTLASLAMVFLSPIFILLLSITVIGIVFVPFFVLALFIAGLFGKAVVLAVLGRRVTRVFDGGPFAHVAVAVVIGGLIVTALYLVPFLGFIVYKVVGILGLGVVAYTLLLILRARAPQAAPVAVGVAPSSAPAFMSMDAASPMHDAGGTASADSTVDMGPTPTSGVPAGGSSDSTVPPVPLTSMPRADFWVRMGALAIDAVLIAVISSFIDGSGDMWLLALAIYGAVMWKLKGTTVGGIICNLRIVRVDGREVDWATCIVRALGCFLSLAAVGLGFIWIALNPERQAWHDKIAGTLVVRVPKGTPLV